MTKRTTRTSCTALGPVAVMMAAWGVGCVGEPLDEPSGRMMSGAIPDAPTDPTTTDPMTTDPTMIAPTTIGPTTADSTTASSDRLADEAVANAPATTATLPTAFDGEAAGPNAADPRPNAIDASAARTVAVDCLVTLPCRAGPPDGGWTVALVTTGDEGTSAAGAPTVGFMLEALTRDTELALADAWLRTSDGRRIEAAPTAASMTVSTTASTALDADDTAHALVPGHAVAGRTMFEPSAVPLPDVIERATVVVRERDALTTLDYENVPWPSDATSAVDCANALPCAWISADGGLALAIDAIGLARWHHSTRLVIDWSATLDRSAELFLADSARAVTDGGKSLEYYGIDFGGTTSRGEGALSTRVTSGSAVAAATGRVVFRRAPPETATSLASASFELSRDDADRRTRWRVELRNLPLAR